MRMLIAGGGTGGHVVPGLALADQLLVEEPTAQVLFVGSARGLEKEMVPAAGYPLQVLQATPLKGRSIIQKTRTLVSLPPLVLQAFRIIRRFQPDVVVGVGGYASAPVIFAASIGRYPIALLEQNAVMGATNRWLSRIAQAVLTSFPQTIGTPVDRTSWVGNPLQPRLVRALWGPAAPTNGATTLLVLGGSQGAQAVNEAVLDAAPILASRVKDLRIIHQTGSRNVDRVTRGYADRGLRAKVAAFISDMAGTYSQTTLVVSRAGATTLAELALAGLPAVLIPLPHAADDHQMKNAVYFRDAGAAIVLNQQHLSGEVLARTVSELLSNGERLQSMSQAMKGCCRPNAASQALNQIRRLTHPK